MSDDETRWWGKPLDARVYHVFEGEHPLAKSLCGSWSMGYVGGEPEVDPESDTYREGEDCKASSRKAGVLAGENE
ncbi:hypothetical protein [Natrarchaeobaculum aegyptiacum]|uniref:Uncharacterized protein n=1 Tax=Natrarchaeobaculum aegyptiacum TaxID=745377 RepID=A0A2Z2HZH9_9EURY|nr:hypothetical protein [Natrarchaeobaculum aegyptiacum]ARS91397.1 hypothetical protein B1756_17845 [Natrarchaeobaculum aegyptiacum]